MFCRPNAAGSLLPAKQGPESYNLTFQPDFMEYDSGTHDALEKNYNM